MHCLTNEKLDFWRRAVAICLLLPAIYIGQAWSQETISLDTKQTTDNKYSKDGGFRAEQVGPLGPIVPLSTLGKASIGLETEDVKKRPKPRQIKTTGTIESIPTREFVQHAMVSGRIEQVLVNLGDHIKAGQTLAIIDSPDITKLTAEYVESKADIEADLAQQQSDLDAEIAQATQDYQIAKINYDRAQKLFDEGIGAKKESQQASADMAVADSKLKAAKRKRSIIVNNLQVKLRVHTDSFEHQLRQAGISAAQIKDLPNRSNTLERAPIVSARGGVITSIEANVGESIEPNTPLFRLSDQRRVWATADIYEDDISLIKVGQPVVGKVAAYPRSLFSGKLIFLGNEIDKVKRTLPVRIELNNPDLSLKPEMFADLYIETEKPAAIISVPREAVIERYGHYFIFVERKNGFQTVRVELGRDFGDEVEVLAGLKLGEKVVIKGAFQLDAELLKSSGGQIFAPPATGEDLANHGHKHDEHETGKDESNSLTKVIPLVVGIMVAFLVGFLINGLLFGRKSS